MSTLFERRVAEVAVWYEYNKNAGVSDQQRFKFYQKTIDCLLELLVIAARDVQRLENRSGNAEVKKILLPNGVILHDEIRTTV